MAASTSFHGKLLIGGNWLDGGGCEWFSRGPLEDTELWRGRWADAGQVDAAVAAACQALPAWNARGLEERAALVRGFAVQLEQQRAELADLIARESGKPLWEAATEVGTAIAKVANSIDAILERRWTKTEPAGELTAVTRYRPHGVMAVLGPFNLPAHLPGAHIIPALLAGNTVVFKPSELTPAVGQWLARAWEQAGLPPGVVNLLHGQAEVAQQLAAHDDVAGVLFTGSYRVGCALHKLLAGRPEKVLALEMGGNNPLIVHRIEHFEPALLTILESAYITSGQRCTCARRLIVTEAAGPERLLPALQAAVARIRVGLPLDHPQPYMGPLIRPVAAERILAAQTGLLERGARPLVLAARDPRAAALVTPGLLDATDCQLDDEEYFGPLLLIERTSDLPAAVELANQTRFGLAAAILSGYREDFEYASQHLRAGLINWNRQTTGANGRLPFGGIGASGNHAPSGYFAADYCSYPVASLESERLGAGSLPPGLEGVLERGT
jgi:succinylglutamic semialdehyde dehydrogenase